jgi:hypothetical protein
MFQGGHNMGLLNFNLKMPDLSNLSSIKEAAMSKIESLGLGETADKIGGIISGNSLVSGLSDSVMSSIQDSMPSMDMNDMMDFDMDSLMGDFSADSLNNDITEMVNGINLDIGE